MPRDGPCNGDAAFAREIVERFLNEETTPRLIGVIAAKIRRLARTA